jgi:hypothetical protein
MTHDSHSSVEQKNSDQDRPQSHEVCAKARRHGHVNTESNQYPGHEDATNTSKACGFGNAAASAPEYRAQHPPAVEGITWE